jgi:hypothetical protein
MALPWHKSQHLNRLQLLQSQQLRPLLLPRKQLQLLQFSKRKQFSLLLPFKQRKPTHLLMEQQEQRH